MTGEFSPALILIVGALLVPLLRGKLRAIYMLALPVLTFWYLLGLSYGEFGQLQAFDLTLTTVRVDKLSLVFGYIFLIATFLGVIYALHVEDTLQHVAALVYAGSAIGAVFAGDLITLLVYWEGTAIASVFLIWARRTDSAYRAGMRYLVMQVLSGLALMAGIIIHYRQTGSIAFGHLGIESLATWLIFLGFGIKCAFPLLHNWLQDAYPEATVTGTVILSVFTTKLAVYALARGYAGTELMVPIGAAMAVLPTFYALIENDLRRVLSYSLMGQLGFMVVGIGIGTDAGLGGAVTHAFCSVLYQALLFMVAGAVLYRVGTINGSDLGGLYKSMPWTAAFCLVGAASIAAFPVFSGFVSKAMTISASLEQERFWTWLMLLLASAGVLLHSGIKVPYLAFFAPDAGKRCAEAPLNMLIAMGITAALSVLIGVYPQPLYAILPVPVNFVPYTLEHVTTQLQLLLFSALAFAVLMRTGLYPAELRATNLDSDWAYRRAGRDVALWIGRTTDALWRALVGDLRHGLRWVADHTYRHHGPDSVLARPWPTGSMALWTAVMLAAYLILSYVRL